MIKRPTVLILGAGASIPFGFPSGRALLIEVCNHIRVQKSNLKTTLLACGYEQDLIKQFGHELLLSAQPSIDSFLEHRPEYMEIGKAAIACSLIPREEAEALHRSQELRWYEYLFNRLKAPQSDFADNELAIITFNYDRSLEQFLLVALRYSYGIDDEEAADLLKTLPVIHLHGQLGQLPPFASGGRPYEAHLTPEAVKQCVEGIRIIHEDFDPEPQFEQAYGLIADAEVICFLGFGYHPANVDRLKIPDHARTSKSLYGTAYGLKEAEIDAINKMFGNRLLVGHQSQDNLEFLRSRLMLD